MSTKTEETWEKDKVKDAVSSLEQDLGKEIQTLMEEQVRELQNIKQKIEVKTIEEYDKSAVKSVADKAKQEVVETFEREKKAREKERAEEKEMELIETNLGKFDKLPKYKFGDFLGKKSFELHELPMETMENVQILVFGPTGAGKTCFINSVLRLFGFPDRCVTQDAGDEGTLHMESFLEEFKFSLVDSRGFFNLKGEYMDELQNILSGRIQMNDIICRKDDEQPEWQNIAKEAAPLPGRIHGLICVLDFDDGRFEQYQVKMEEYRSFFKEEGYSPVSVVLHKRDTGDEDRTTDAALAVGASADRTFQLTNHIAMETDFSVKSKATIAEILESTLIGAEQYARLTMLGEKRKKTEIKKQNDRLDLDMFLERMQSKYLFKDAEIAKFKESCLEEDVTNMEHLKELRDDMGSLVPVWGMAPLLKFEIDKLFGC